MYILWRVWGGSETHDSRLLSLPSLAFLTTVSQRMSVIPMGALSILSSNTAMGEIPGAGAEYSAKCPEVKEHTHSAYYCIPNA